MKAYILKMSDLSNEIIDALSNFISDDKKIRIKNFYRKDDKIRCLLGDLLIRWILINEFDMINKEIIFGKNNYGKPFIKGKANPYFNISHSGEYIVCYIGSSPVGIDIELIKEIDVNGIAKDFFTKEEYNYILGNRNKITLKEKLNRFYNIWTIKESFIKCVGKGLSIPLNSFSITISDSNKITVNLTENKEDFSFNIIYFDDHYKLSACSLNNDVNNEIEYVDEHDIINQFLNIHY